MTGGYAPRIPMTALPGVQESVRLLVESEQYSLTDVALMFGVSRGRIGQLCQKWDMTTPGHGGQRRGLWATRVWDDRQHRFLPVANRVLRRERQTRNRVTRAMDRLARHNARQAAMVSAIRTAYESARRPLTIREMCLACGLPPNGGNLVESWCPNRRKNSRSGALAEIRAAVGMPSRSRGSLGQLAPKRRRTSADQCGRGHWLTDAYDRGDGTLCCRVCQHDRYQRNRPPKKHLDDMDDMAEAGMAIQALAKPNRTNWLSVRTMLKT